MFSLRENKPYDPYQPVKRAAMGKLLAKSGHVIAHRGGHRYKSGNMATYQTSGDWRIANSAEAFDHAGDMAAKTGVVPMVETDTLLSQEGLAMLQDYRSDKPLPEHWRDAVFLCHADPKEVPGKNKMDWPLFWLGHATPLDAFSYSTPAATLRQTPIAEEEIRPGGTPQTMLSLVEFLDEYVKKRGYHVQIEIKPHSYPTYRKINEAKGEAVQRSAFHEGELITRIMQEVLGPEDMKKVSVLSCSTYVLKGVHNASPSTPTMWLLVPENVAHNRPQATRPGASILDPHTKGRIDPYLMKENVAKILKACHVTGIHYMTPNIDPSVFQYYREQGFMSIIGGAETPRDATQLLTRADGISADNYRNVLDCAKTFNPQIASRMSTAHSSLGKS